MLGGGGRTEEEEEEARDTESKTRTPHKVVGRIVSCVLRPYKYMVLFNCYLSLK